MEFVVMEFTELLLPFRRTSFWYAPRKASLLSFGYFEVERRVELRGVRFRSLRALLLASLGLRRSIVSSFLGCVAGWLRSRS
jgi:hypothetical protein